MTLRNEILTSVGQIVHKMIALDLVKRKPSDKELTDALRQLAGHNIIQKISGAWEEADTKVLILPSILFVVTNEKISRMYEMIEAEEALVEQEEAEAAADMDVLRGEEDLS